MSLRSQFFRDRFSELREKERVLRGEGENENEGQRRLKS